MYIESCVGRNVHVENVVRLAGNVNVDVDVRADADVAMFGDIVANIGRV